MSIAAPTEGPIRDELNRLAGELRERLPEHTYRAVILLVKTFSTDEKRRSWLADALAERERSEEHDRQVAEAKAARPAPRRDEPDPTPEYKW